MNPWNKLFLFNTWFLVATALCGTYFAGIRDIAPVALVVIAVLFTGAVIGGDRHDRHCPEMQESAR